MSGAGAHVAAGLAAGAIDALLAVAIVLVRRASGVVNFAQAALATLSAFGCATLVAHGWRFWPAFAVTVALSFGGGLVLAGALVAPVRRGPVYGWTLLTVGLLLAVNGLDNWIWGPRTRPFAGPFSAHTIRLAGGAVSRRDLGTVVVAGAALVVVAVVGRSKAGLGLRAAAADPGAAHELGLGVGRLGALAWALAAALGAVAGVLAATAHGLDPTLLRSTLLSALAGAFLGGIDSPAGAALGGSTVGVGLELLATYVHGVGSSLRPVAAFAVLLAAILLRPSGLRGRWGRP